MGPNGIDAVQISPVTEHILGSQWYTKYQPVGAQFASGCLQFLFWARRWGRHLHNESHSTPGEVRDNPLAMGADIRFAVLRIGLGRPF